MSVAAIDIGTNSMRLLILSDTGAEVHRQLEVTGLGVGVDAAGRFADGPMKETLEVMSGFGSTLALHNVDTVAAVATSATRDAKNGEAFIAAVADRVGVAPQIISGRREAELAYAGATRGVATKPHLVIDIGGGSTEFIRGTSAVDTAMSIDIGSVRLTDRVLRSRPASLLELAVATDMVADLFAGVPRSNGAAVVGVAGTFTSLAAISLALPAYDRDTVDGSTISAGAIESLINQLARLTIPETAAIPSLHPRRGRVILAGAIIAAGAIKAVGAEHVTVSESDLLDGLAWELLARRG